MAEAIELKAWARARSGKGGARAERREGRVPGTLYGDKQEPETISVDYRAINHQLHTGHFQSTIYVLDVDGKKTRVIPRARAARSGPRLSHPCRFHAARQGCAGDGRGAGAVPERGGLARPEARRRAQHRAPRDRGALPGRRHPRPFRGRPDRAGDRRLGAHLGDQAARGREADHHRARLHRRHHRRPRARKSRWPARPPPRPRSPAPRVPRLPRAAAAEGGEDKDKEKPKDEKKKDEKKK